MSDWRIEVQGITQSGQIKMPYTWSVGEVGSRFLIALRDQEKILGNRCPKCNTVYVPPRKNCGKCFVEMDSESLVELGTQGIVTALTIVRDAYPLQPIAPPFAYVIVKLDGADVGFVHLVKENLERLQSGTRVQAVFKRERSGHILDIDCFEVVAKP